MIYHSIRAVIFIAACLMSAITAAAQPSGLSFMDMKDIQICPVDAADLSPPTFSSKNCHVVSLGDIDPQIQPLWVKVNVPLSSARGPNGEPLSLYISGKMSSRVYLNGDYVGDNGRAALDAKTEIPGRMDAEFFPPQDLFKQGNNDVVFLASSHHGVLHLRSPLHMVGIAPTGLYASASLPRFVLPLLTFGLFLLGSLYFGIMALMGQSRPRYLTLCAICFFAGGQLISESLRGILAYTYPIHDYRLIAIMLFSSAFGLSVAFHIFRTFMSKGLVVIMAGLIILSAAASVMFEGFDHKALAVMSAPLMASLIALAVWSHQRRPRAFLYFITLLTLTASIFIFRGLFLDSIFFLLLAVFLLLLFIEQAVISSQEARERRREQARANRLELALAEAEERRAANHINVKSAGKMERIATRHIVHCQGASGYSEIVMENGRSLLHSASLNDMEDALPATFLRVHRSHLINVIFVKSLRRDPAGTGILTLTQGSEIPVSRRIMPKVRQALTQ